MLPALYFEETLEFCINCPTSLGKQRVRRTMGDLITGEWRCVRNIEQFFTNPNQYLVVYRHPSKKLYGVYDPVNEDYEKFCQARYSYLNANQKRYQQSKKADEADTVSEDDLGAMLVEKAVKDKKNDKDPVT